MKTSRYVAPVLACLLLLPLLLRDCAFAALHRTILTKKRYGG